MKKSKIFLSIVGAISMLVAATSCDLANNTKMSPIAQDVYNNGESLIFNYASWNEDYQAAIVLSKYLDSPVLPTIGYEYTVTIYYVAVDDINEINKSEIASNDSVDGYYYQVARSLFGTNDVPVQKGGLGVISETYKITAENYNTTDVSQIKLFLDTDGLRDDETITNHVDSLVVKAKIEVEYKATNEIYPTIETIAAGIDGTKYTYIKDDKIHDFYFEAGKTYYVEWVDGYNDSDDSNWNNTFVKDPSWKTLVDCGYKWIGTGGSNITNTTSSSSDYVDDSKTISYTPTESGIYGIKGYSRGEGISGAFHIYSN